MDVVEHALLTTLWNQWGEQPPVVPADGNRLFIRTVNADPDDPHWDDWRLIGLVGADGRVQWFDVDPEQTPLAVTMQERITEGLRHGRQFTDGFGLEWGLFHGDGPVEVRVSDWATPQDGAADEGR